MTTDPTPRTAATARDALVTKITSDWDADPYGEYGAAKDRLVRDLDALIALAAAEHAVRAAALVDAGNALCLTFGDFYWSSTADAERASAALMRYQMAVARALAAPAPTPSDPVARS